jgi:exosortase C (VPDSG-CTERM-specific)
VEEKITSSSFRKFILAGGVLVLVFFIPLWQLLHFSVRDELYSYIPLMPLISGYLIWIKRKNLPREFSPAPGLATIFFAAGLTVIGVFWFKFRSENLMVEDKLAFTTFSFLLFFIGISFWFLGKKTMRALAFPMAMLIFLVPLPVFLRNDIDTALQNGSATAADWMFALTNVPVLRDGLYFRLTDITLQVAPECSGIHSTVVLLITSLVAGYIFFETGWRRMVLMLAVIPLAILRNGFRIFVIGQLCARIGPQMIDSPIHHRGGPLFFIISLIPFFLLLYFLKKSEHNKIVKSALIK